MEGMVTWQGPYSGLDLKVTQTNDAGTRILLVHVNVRSQRVYLGSAQSTRLRFADGQRIQWHSHILSVSLPVRAMMVMMVVVGAMHVMVEMVGRMVVLVCLVALRSNAILEVDIENMTKNVVRYLWIGEQS